MTDATAAPRAAGNRRVEPDRRQLELLLDSVFRPAHWAARAAFALGLQGHIHESVTELALRGAAAAARPTLRIAFASDFHAGATTDHRLLEDAFARLRAFRADLLLLGGDFVSVRASYIDSLAELIAGVDSPLGKFGVLGNHDLRADHRRVTRSLEAAGVQMLTNRNTTLRTPFDDVTLCGLDDATRGEPRADHALDGATGTRVVLMHSPEGLEALGDHHWDLALCGHTHGGQVTLPSGTPLLVPGGPLNRQYCSGLFALEGAGARQLLVSRGVGCSTIPVRLFAAPEVHLCLIS